MLERLILYNDHNNIQFNWHLHPWCEYSYHGPWLAIQCVQNSEVLRNFTIYRRPFWMASSDHQRIFKSLIATETAKKICLTLWPPLCLLKAKILGHLQVQGIHTRPVDSLHKGPMRKAFWGFFSAKFPCTIFFHRRTLDSSYQKGYCLPWMMIPQKKHLFLREASFCLRV